MSRIDKETYNMVTSLIACVAFLLVVTLAITGTVYVKNKEIEERYDYLFHTEEAASSLHQE